MAGLPRRAALAAAMGGVPNVSALQRAGIIASLLLALLPGVSLAQAPDSLMPDVCGNHETVILRLKQAFGEELTGFGLGATGKTVFELAVDPKDGTWTILRTFADPASQELESCIMATGRGWATIEPEPAGDPL